MIFNSDGNLVDLKMKIDATTKSDVLNKNKYTFKDNTLLFGDLNTDFHIVNNNYYFNFI